jgi:hypothetical protein
MEKVQIANELLSPYKGTLKQEVKIPLKRKKNHLYKKTLRVLIGPLLGFWLAFLGHQVFQISLIPSMLIIASFTIAGIIIRYKYIKFIFLFLIASINVYLVLNMVKS